MRERGIGIWFKDVFERIAINVGFSKPKWDERERERERNLCPIYIYIYIYIY